MNHRRSVKNFKRGFHDVNNYTDITQFCNRVPYLVIFITHSRRSFVRILLRRAFKWLFQTQRSHWRKIIKKSKALTEDDLKINPTESSTFSTTPCHYFHLTNSNFQDEEKGFSTMSSLKWRRTFCLKPFQITSNDQNQYPSYFVLIFIVLMQSKGCNEK